MGTSQLRCVNCLSYCLNFCKVCSGQKNASEFPCHWISLNDNNAHHVPFNVRQKAFQKAFNECYMDYVKRSKPVMNRKHIPNSKFLADVAECMK